MPYWRLSTFYLFYFVSIGAFVPYWTLYLKSLGYSSAEIGELMAVIMITKVVSPNVWGWLADHTGRRMLIVQIGCVCAALGFVGVFFAENYWQLMLVMLFYSFFWNATLPQFEATTLNHLGDNPHRYSMIRLWGSIGFIIAVALLGQILAIEGAMIVPQVLLAVLAVIALMSLWMPAERVDTTPSVDSEPLLQVLRKPQVAAVLVACFLNQASHGPYYTFYTIYLETHGYSSGVIGLLWALGVIAEVGVFLIMHRLVQGIGLRRLFMISMMLTSVRWVMIGFGVENPAVLLAAQLLHAASFGIYHAVAIQLIHRFFKGKHQGKGQAMYSSVSFGLGGAVGALYAGYLWEWAGATQTFLVAAVLSAAAYLVVWRGVRGMH
ncbi:MAG: MFS transporter [Pseudomonadota bacterium]